MIPAATSMAAGIIALPHAESGEKEAHIVTTE